MKTLQNLAKTVNGEVVKLTFKSNGLKQLGYAIIDQDKNELVVIEPVHYSNGDRWLVVNRCRKTEWNFRLFYCKSIRGLSELIGIIEPGYTGFKLS